jgi:hypothetical protein
LEKERQKARVERSDLERLAKIRAERELAAKKRQEEEAGTTLFVCLSVVNCVFAVF